MPQQVTKATENYRASPKPRVLQQVPGWECIMPASVGQGWRDKAVCGTGMKPPHCATAVGQLCSSWTRGTVGQWAHAECAGNQEWCHPCQWSHLGWSRGGNQSSPRHYWRRNSGFGCMCTRITSPLNAFMVQLKPVMIFLEGKPYPSRVNSASLELTGPLSLCCGFRAADRLGRLLSARHQ